MEPTAPEGNISHAPAEGRRIRSPRVTIELTEDLLANAIQADSSHCMIAEAIKAQVPGASNVSVDLQTIRWSDRKKGRRYTYLTPPAFQEALLRFDQGEPIPPFRATVGSAVHIGVVRAAKTKDDGTPDTRPTGKSRQVSAGPRRIQDPIDGGVATVIGGNSLPAAVLSNAKGHTRRFGMRLAKPGVAGDPGPGRIANLGD